MCDMFFQQNVAHHRRPDCREGGAKNQSIASGVQIHRAVVVPVQPDRWRIGHVDTTVFPSDPLGLAVTALAALIITKVVIGSRAGANQAGKTIKTDRRTTSSKAKNR